MVRDVARAFEIPRSQVRVQAQFVGGGFGSKFGAGQHTIMAAHLARKAKAPVQLILNRREDCPISWLTTAGLSTVALRISDHPVANDLIRKTGRPIAAPSANKSGKISPTRAEDVLYEFQNELDTILNGGDCRVGLESTVLDVSGNNAVILRPGYISQTAIENNFGPVIF